jgi:replicative superfamily II helicase
MSHWLLERLHESRQKALALASALQVHHEVCDMSPQNPDTDLLRRTGETLELVVLDLVQTASSNDAEQQKECMVSAADAFYLYRALPRPTDAIEEAKFLLRSSMLALLGDKGADAARWLRESPWSELPMTSQDWGKRTWATVLDTWLRLVRKHGWTDRDAVLQRIADLRSSQAQFEGTYLTSQPPALVKVSALELVGLYHVAKAAELLALYITDGVVDGNYQVHQLLETQFDRVLAVCQLTPLIDLEPLSRLLNAGSSRMVENSIWTVTRAVNSRVTGFVKSLVERGRGDRAIFDVLPPQRRTLAERGLLGSSRRAVVVSLPTSSGKTLIAQFRILQALNQFDQERGWVAYLVPTRTLVNQITRQLRRDFEPLGIVVEQVSPALEVDNVESALLHQHVSGQEFRILVTTPEKLDLLLRQGLETNISRPLTLVVVDEAHNIQSASRGLKLELLLATINNECQRAQFLLLTPFISNAREVARWLGGNNSDDVSLALEWQPNDRVIGIVKAEKGEVLRGRSHDYHLSMETVHTTRRTLTTDDLLTLPKNEEIAETYSRVNHQKELAAVTAQHFQQRGPVIVMHTRPDWVWSLAAEFRIESNRLMQPSGNIVLVQQFLKLEFGSEFPLIDLLNFGVGVHHSGLSDDVRALMEWLFESGDLRCLVATTTLAQGVNFPVSGVIMASHQYPYGEDMPPEDFWNIAGRAGRIGQGSLGIVALVASSVEKATALRNFIHRQTGDLNSALLSLAREARDMMSDLEGIVYPRPEWSTFVQYLVHTYRQMGEPAGFADEIEQVLRGTFGFEKLRSQEPALATMLLTGVRTYTDYLRRPGQPLKLVDSTGFSLQSIKTVFAALGNEGVNQASWNSESLFAQGDRNLQNMMGVLLKVPELRKNLIEVTGGSGPDGDKLALIVKDWVNGVPVPEIAERYFKRADDDYEKAMTTCGQHLFGRLTQTAAWGLGALLSIMGSDMREEQFDALRNLPSRVYYGVNNDASIALRLLGVPRAAAPRLATTLSSIHNQSLATVRGELRELESAKWTLALGETNGEVYRTVWRILEGLS